VQKVQKDAIGRLLNMSSSERYAFFENKRADLAGLQKTATLDYDLDEALISLEALVNNDFYNYWEEITSEVLYEDDLDLSYTLVNGERKVSFVEFATRYAELYNRASGYVDVNNNENFIFLSLEVIEVDDNQGTAKSKIKTMIATVPPSPVFLTPAGAVTAVKNAVGPCNPSGNLSGDAADFLKAYCNLTAPWRTLTCANGSPYYSLLGLKMTTYNWDQYNSQYIPPFPNSSSWPFVSNVLNQYWHSNTNECLGGPDPADWYALYNKMDVMMAFGDQYLTQYAINQNLPHANDVMFHITDYHSHNVPLNPLQVNDDIPEDYYHGGNFFYAIWSCP